MRKYTPRRAGKKWLEGAPAYVLDVFDHPKFGDRYSVYFCGEFLITDGTYAGTWIPVLSMSGAPTHPQGISLWGENKAYEVAQYRYKNKHRRIKWMDLPEHIRKHVIARAETSGC